MNFSSDDISINTLIGQGSFVTGDIKINGFIRVDGDVLGKIDTSSNVIIGEKARIKGNITAKSIVIGGIVIGDINAQKNITLLSNSVVIGDLTTNNLKIEDNVVFNGHCISLRNEDEYKDSVQRFTDQKLIQSKVI